MTIKPIDPIVALSYADILGLPKDAESDRLQEAEYRRGYRDGWIAAVEAMFNRWFLGKRRVYDMLWDHWEWPLLWWVQHQLGSRLIFPPSVDGPYCTYCGVPAEHLDHVIPRSRGGTSNDDNLVPACARCNLAKGAKTPEEWLS